MIFAAFMLIGLIVIVGSIIFTLGTIASSPAGSPADHVVAMILLVAFVGGLFYVIHLFTKPDCDGKDRFGYECQLERSGGWG